MAVCDCLESHHPQDSVRSSLLGQCGPVGVESPGSTLPQKIILACARGEISQMLLGVHQQCQCQDSGPVLYSSTMRQGEVLPARMAAEELLLSSGFCRPLLDCESPQVSWNMEGCNAQECDAECLSVWWLEALAI